MSHLEPVVAAVVAETRQVVEVGGKEHTAYMVRCTGFDDSWTTPKVYVTPHRSRAIPARYVLTTALGY